MQIKLVCMNLGNLKEEKGSGRLFVVCCFKKEILILFLKFNIIYVCWKLAEYSDY